ncbi:MAG: class I SAM-dependent methyltransferase [Nocardioidaceae bacterium]
MDAATQRRLGISFDRAADRYAASRPAYPDAAVDWLLAGRDGDVLDLGAGSGSLTRALTLRVARVVAAEPSPHLLAELRAGSCAVPAVRAGAELLPFAVASFDVVAVATAFHWFDAERALPEIARTMRRGGHLALIWNTRTLTVPWTHELDLLLRSAQPPTLHGAWGTDSVHWLEKSARFARPEYAEFDHVQLLDRDSLLALVGSRSYVISLPPPDQEALLAKVARLFDASADPGGTLALPYRAQCWRAGVHP